jgi:hypothetical protein
VWPLDDASVDRAAIPITANLYDKTHWNVNLDDDALQVGMFQPSDENGRPSGWDDVSAFDAGFARLRVGGNGADAILSGTPAAKRSISTFMDLPENAEHLTFVVRLRGPNLRKDDVVAGAGVTVTFLDADGGQRTMPRLEPAYEGYRDWIVRLGTARVRDGERRLRVDIEVINAMGDLEVDSIRIIPSTASGEATTMQSRTLEQVLKEDDADAVAELIRSDRRMLEMRTGHSDNGTPLIRAAWMGKPKVVAKLIELGADVEAIDHNWGNTPLEWCSWWGTHEVAKVLVEAGADTRGVSRRAQSAKTRNGSAQRPAADFDKISKLVDDYEANLKRD